jgi:hypothetical protein
MTASETMVSSCRYHYFLAIEAYHHLVSGAAELGTTSSILKMLVYDEMKAMRCTFMNRFKVYTY